MSNHFKAPFIFGPNSNGRIEWVGYSDVNTMKISSRYVKKMRLGGVAAWSIESDDYTGDFCGQGPYPLLTTLNKLLMEKSITPFTYAPNASKEIIKTTTPITSTETQITTDAPK